MLSILNHTFKGFGLVISFKKTKTQVFNNEDLANQDSSLSVGPKQVEIQNHLSIWDKWLQKMPLVVLIQSGKSSRDVFANLNQCYVIQMPTYSHGIKE